MKKQVGHIGLLLAICFVLLFAISQADAHEWGYWPADLSLDRTVNFGDFVILAGEWLNDTDSNDLGQMAEQWLYCSDANNSDCHEPAHYTDGILYLPGEVEIELLTSGNVFQGIGQVSIRGTLVRNGNTPMNVKIDTVAYPIYSTVYYAQVLLDSVQIHTDGLGADIFTTLDRGNGLFDNLTWIFRSISNSWDGHNASGFSYSFRFQSIYRQVHKIIETGTWSLDGTVNGRTFATQRESYGRRSSHAVTIDTSTELERWNYLFSYKVAPESRIATNDLIDYLEMPGKCLVRNLSDFQITYIETYRYPGDSEITCEEHYVTPKAYDFATVPMEIHLYDRSGQNAWIQAREYVLQLIYEAADMTGYEQDPMPMMAIPDLAELGNPRDLSALVNKIKNKGIQGVWVWARWQTDWSVYGQPGDLSHSVHDIEWATNKYDVSALSQFCQLANAEGIKVCMWTPGGHLSTRSPLRSSYPSWITYKYGGQPFTYVYSEVGGNNFAAGLGAHILNKLQARQSEVLFAGIWLDSFQVFGAESINYGDGIWTPNFDGAVEFVKQARTQLGLTVMSETGFPLGLSSSTGTYNPSEPLFQGKEWTAYKTNKYHCYQQSPGHPSYNPVSSAMYFRLLAYKAAMIFLESEWDSDSGLLSIGVYANKAYRNSQQFMKKCVALDNDRGTVWYSEDGSAAVLWTFNSNTIDLGRNIATAVDATWGYNVSFTGSTITPGAIKVTLITFVE
ncbi:MAG: hypothetical protein ABIG61_00125 [Planctomycetota bacterium]